MNKIKEFARLLGGFFYDPHLACASCGADLFEEGYFCPVCKDTLPFHRGSVCSKCGRDAGEYPVCAECKADMPSFDRARSVFSYEGAVVGMIRALKTGRRYLAEVFAGEMAKIAAAQFADAELVLFVPMTKRAEKRRGYNQARLLAERICALTGLPLAEDALVKTRETGEQKDLSRRERKKNLAGSFRVHRRALCAGKRILLVDDVLTTGATASAAAEALFRAGVLRVDLLTAASVPQKRENRRK